VSAESEDATEVPASVTSLCRNFRRARATVADSELASFDDLLDDDFDSPDEELESFDDLSEDELAPFDVLSDAELDPFDALSDVELDLLEAFDSPLSLPELEPFGDATGDLDDDFEAGAGEAGAGAAFFSWGFAIAPRLVGGTTVIWILCSTAPWPATRESTFI